MQVYVSHFYTMRIFALSFLFQIRFFYVKVK